MTGADNTEAMVATLERFFNGWLDKGYRYVWFKPDGACMPVLPEMDLDDARGMAKARGYELLGLTVRSTQVRVAEWLLASWLQNAREEGQRELAGLVSPLPGRGGSA